MISIIHSLGKVVWGYFKNNDDLLEDEENLEKELRKLQDEKPEDVVESNKSILEYNMECTKRTGKITHLSEDYGIIDSGPRFSLLSSRHLELKLGDVVYFLEFKPNGSSLYNAKVLRKYESLWNDTDNDTTKSSQQDVKSFNVMQRVVIGKVVERVDRNVIIDVENIKFNLDSVASNFIPIVGDWVELFINAQEEDNTDIHSGEVLEVVNVRCVRSKTAEGFITKWDTDNGVGVIDNLIFVNMVCCDNSIGLSVGDKVIYDAIESEQNKLSWRALSIALLSTIKYRENAIDNINAIENTHGIFISNDFDLGRMVMGERRKFQIEVRNDGFTSQRLFRIAFHTKFHKSQLRLMTPVENIDITPGKSILLQFESFAKIMGFSDEEFVFSFKGFKIIRIFKIDVCDSVKRPPLLDSQGKVTQRELLKRLENCTNSEVNFIHAPRLTKPPPFVKLRIQKHMVPPKIWNTFFKNVSLVNNEMAVLLEEIMPALSKVFDKTCYKERLHNLLYIEEMKNFIQIKTYDMEKAYMRRTPPYLSLDIEGLVERRPSLQAGDSVRVTNPWSKDSPLYEGFIHKVHSDSIDLRFCEEFASKYNGEDVSIEFFFCRTPFNKWHFAIDLAFSHLGPQVLFPDRLVIRDTLVDIIDKDRQKHTISKNKENTNKLKIRHIKWFNKKLNSIQKDAVINAITGSTRPLPYVIFGPPGTGKTVTVVETIMQLLCLVPESRLLIATPSNSAVNLIAERLIHAGKFLPGSLIRLVSHSHIESGTLPDVLKPYCGTINVSIENSGKSHSRVDDSGIHYGLGKTYVGRQRIVMGTCMTVSTLIQLGFPFGHFTHVLIDEAGQATEPEIMIPLSYIHNTNGQIILSGDPVQLGPVVMSPIAQRFGLDISYLERLLQCYPYQKDVIGRSAENCGYDPRLITKLRYNYRSTQSIIELSSKLFYENSLISQIDQDRSKTPWVDKAINNLSGIFEKENPPGIIFHGVRGINHRGEDNPSWFNPQEASMVLLFICNLYNRDFNENDIGIITPYCQQVKHIRSLLEDINIPCPKIGSVEEFQGQERKIIIVSTVRSHETFVTSDKSHFLGFVGQPKRINVALTRAQILMVIFGNPHLLVVDPIWRSVLHHVIERNGYFGCDLPPCLYS